MEPRTQVAVMAGILLTSLHSDVAALSGFAQQSGQLSVKASENLSEPGSSGGKGKRKIQMA